MVLCAAGLLAAAPRSLAAQCPDGTPPPCRGARVAARAPAGPAVPSLAVLYFDNLSRDTGDVYLADGVTEELMTRLVQVEGIEVKSRAAVQRERARAAGDPLAAGRALGVAHLVSGSVVRARGRLRITVDLTSVASGNSEWARSFERPADDLLGAEAEIAESVAVNVGAALLPAERRRMEERPTSNPAAYDALLRGRFDLERRTSAGLLAAVRAYHEAARLDPRLTEAVAGEGTAYTMLSGIYYDQAVGIPRDTLFARGQALVERAFRQDSTSIYVVLARTWALHLRESLPLYAQAVARYPRDATAHHDYGIALRDFGQDSAAVAELKAAIALEPDRVISLLNLGQTYLVPRQFAEAAVWLDSAVALQPEASFYYLEDGLNKLQLGDTAGARAMATLTAAHGSAVGREELLALLEARAGDSAAARARMAGVDSSMAHRDCYLSHECLELAMTLASVGSTERALAVLGRFNPPDAWLAYWTRRAEFDPIRSDPRFQRLVAAATAEGQKR